MDAPKIYIRGGLAIGEGFVEVFRSSLSNFEVADTVEAFVLNGNSPASACITVFAADDVIHHLLPGAGEEFWI